MSARDTDNWPAHEAQAKAIAAELGPEWSAANTSHTPDEWQCWELQRADGLTLSLGWPTPYGANANKPRLEVRGVFPRDNAGDMKTPSRYSNEPTAPTSITVDVNTAAGRVAKAIKSRLLAAGFEATYANLVARVDSANAYEDKTKATNARILAAIPGAHISHNGSKATFYTSKNHVYSATAQGDSVRIEAFNCPTDVAIAILQLTQKKEEEAEE